MNRKGFRLLGIALGLVVGTIGAIVTHTIRKSLRNTEPTSATSDDSVGIVLPPPSHTLQSEEQEVEQIAPKDPGNRKQLAQLREAAKAEPNWTRSFELIERSGLLVRSEELKGQPYIACFFFSTCPGTCKRQSSEMRLLQSKFKGQPIKLVSISVDPEVDTPEALTAYAESFNADPKQWLFLTGNLDDIVRVGTEMFFLPGVERRGHPDRFCLVNAQGELVGSYVWLDEEERQLLVEHAEELLAQQAQNGGQGEDSGNP